MPAWYAIGRGLLRRKGRSELPHFFCRHCSMAYPEDEVGRFLELLMLGLMAAVGCCVALILFA